MLSSGEGGLPDSLAGSIVHFYVTISKCNMCACSKQFHRASTYIVHNNIYILLCVCIRVIIFMKFALIHRNVVL